MTYRVKVMEVVYTHGPITASEVVDILTKEDGEVKNKAIRRALYHMEFSGHLQVIKCSLTDRGGWAYTYDITEKGKRWMGVEKEVTPYV